MTYKQLHIRLQNLNLTLKILSASTVMYFSQIEKIKIVLPNADKDEEVPVYIQKYVIRTLKEYQLYDDHNWVKNFSLDTASN